ncbi:hypothetical protein [Mesorhizobium sp.]|uniref:hypothetical protein n=1 Tax=Mesorhizobium sp. TaxID=1871066 RepID=UPI000FE62A46|nr:hypothetical protein [Mesorhizobium sp.]RWK57085.1 MAG: hypothetical protein EOR49_34200 [Mesorhizobium sp.]RWM45043.1 MAG: hypothetical protein EOR76_22025 [Mesorhizobium sp.]RWM53186.1 MAG: hypothetical protein EOR78_20145 [Mesorhizobium sp.]RWM62493.1 MAG: hypothetical protein EOR79_02900 [Mesorhizobium sp.]RWN00160.1 MAG: hypothetical protein EOR85_16520 [Mesorhizobium sp.]
MNSHTLIPIGDGRAAAYMTAVDGRFRGWICRPDGTRLEAILVKDIDEADERAKALHAKGKI